MELLKPSRFPNTLIAAVMVVANAMNECRLLEFKTLSC